MFSSAPTLVVPSSIVNPVYIPISEVSTLPYSSVIIDPTSPSLAIIASTNIPSSVPSSVVISVSISTPSPVIEHAVPSTVISPVYISASLVTGLPSS